MDHGGNYKGEIWPDKHYYALQMSIGKGISVAVILSGVDAGGEGEGGGKKQVERCGRLRYEIGSSGGFTDTMHTLSHTAENLRSVQLNCSSKYLRCSDFFLFVCDTPVCVCVCEKLTVGTGKSRSGWSDCSSPGSYTLYTASAATLPQSGTVIRGTI